MKRVFCIVLTIVMVLGMFVFTETGDNLKAYAEEDAKSGLFRYYIEDGIAIITGCDESASGTVTVPGKIKGYPVSLGIYGEGFGYNVFLEDNDIKKIVVSDGVKYIGADAIYGCANLKEVVLPDSVIKIGDFAFAYCPKLSKVNIPAKIQCIYSSSFLETAIYNNPDNWIDGCFYYKKCLLSVNENITGKYTVKKGTKHIGTWSLAWTTELETLVLPDSVVTICDNLTTTGINFSYVQNINIPKNVSYIGDNFLESRTPDKITVDPENKYFTMYKGYLCDKKLTKIIRCTAEAKPDWDEEETPEYPELVIPEGIKELASSSFANVDEFKELVIPSSVTKIGGNAFARMGDVDNTTVIIPETVKELCAGAFEDAMFEVIEIKGPIKVIEVATFRDMEYLKTVILPDTLEVLEAQCFMCTPKLKKVVVPDTLKEIEFEIFTDSGYYKNKENWENGLLYLDDYLIEAKESLEGIVEVRDNTKLIANWAFPSNGKVDAVILPKSIKSIGTGNFFTSGDLKTVYYCGSSAEWKKINIGEFNDGIEGAEKIFGYSNDKVITPFTAAVNKKDGVEITWSVVPNAKKYVVYRKEKNSKKWVKIATQTENTYKDTTAVSGKQYSYYVKAYNNSNKSSAYESDKAGSITFISAPEFTLKNVKGGIELKWGKVKGAEKYSIYRQAAGSSKWKKIATVKEKSFTDKTAKNGKNYKYRVKAVLGKSTSAYNTVEQRYISNPALNSVTSTKNGVKLTWSKVNSTDGYIVYRKTGNGSFSKIATVKGNAKVTYTDKSAKKGKTYTYKIKAYNGKTTSAYSNTKKIKDKF